MFFDPTLRVGGTETFGVSLRTEGSGHIVVTSSWATEAPLTGFRLNRSAGAGLQAAVLSQPRVAYLAQLVLVVVGSTPHLGLPPIPK